MARTSRMWTTRRRPPRSPLTATTSEVADPPAWRVLPPAWWLKVRQAQTGPESGCDNY